MNIIVVGCGKVGETLCEHLVNENNDVTIIDTDASRVSHLCSQLDIIGIVGNGASITILNEANIEKADLFIAVTDYDEVNLLCCLIAKKTSKCHTIARVRNPIYHNEHDFIRKELGLSMIINPDYIAATEIARILRLPQAIEINTFAKGRVELLKYKIVENTVLDGLVLKRLQATMHCNILVCAVERGSELIIPNGDFKLKGNDYISFVASPLESNKFFATMNINTSSVKNTMIIGAGRIAYYLCQQLLSTGIKVKVIEQKHETCEKFCLEFPHATIIQGDGTDKELLIEEGIAKTDSFVTLTSFDEENVMLSLFAKSQGHAKLVTKVKRSIFDEIIQDMDLGSIIYPQSLCASYILQYVRALKNSDRSNSIETLYKIINGKAEALEFLIKDNSPILNIPLEDLKLQKGILIACINRKSKIIIPNGEDRILKGDTVIVISQSKRLNDIKDILQ